MVSKSNYRIVPILLILLIGILSTSANPTLLAANSFEPVSIHNHSIQSDGLRTLTWTSRTQLEPQSLENSSMVSGDHVVLNATFPEELNVTHCEMKVFNGFTYTTSRPLVVPTNVTRQFSGVINASEFDWVVIEGIEAGFTVNITCNFTNSDCDFMAWPSSIEPSERRYDNNILDMASGDNPEHDCIIWPENSTMYLACLNYNGSMGNWTLYLDVGDRYTSYANVSSVSMDTYYLDEMNKRYDVLVTGYSSSNETFQIMREDVLLYNYFAPNVSVHEVVRLAIDYRTLNISWSCTDRNLDDIHLYSVWLSNNNGYSYMLLAQNLTVTWYLWNSTGWLEYEYIIRIRAYSVDLTVPGLADLSDPPAGYWPGDFGDGFSSEFLAGDPPIYDPTRDVGVEEALDVNYSEGETGNIIEWIFYYYNPVFPPQFVNYEIYQNGTLWMQSQHTLFWYTNLQTHYNMTLSINVDGLQEGTYNFTLYFENPGSSGGIVRDVVFVIVGPSSLNSTSITNTSSFDPFVSTMLQVLLVISIPGLALVILVVFFAKKSEKEG